MTRCTSTCSRGICPASLEAARPDIVYYQAGVDPLAEDTLGPPLAHPRRARGARHLRPRGRPALRAAGGGHAGGRVRPAAGGHGACTHRHLSRRCAGCGGKLERGRLSMPELTPEVLATLYDESPEPVFVFAPVRDGGRVVDFRYVYANPVALRAVSARLEEKVGQSLNASAPDAERSGLLASYARTMETGEPTDLRIHYDDGRVSGWFRIQAQPRRPRPAGPLPDVTQETQTHAALRQTEAERDRTELRRAALESLLAQVPAEMAYLRGARAGLRVRQRPLPRASPRPRVPRPPAGRRRSRSGRTIRCSRRCARCSGPVPRTATTSIRSASRRRRRLRAPLVRPRLPPGDRARTARWTACSPSPPT